MSLESVRQFFQERGVDVPILITPQTTATVETAAAAHGVSAGEIAKTLAFRLKEDRVILVVAAGDVRVDHGLFKAVFGKGKMLGAEEVVQLTGHPVGGVCTFGLATPLPVYLDSPCSASPKCCPQPGALTARCAFAWT